MRPLITTLCFTLLLTGCIPAALVVGATAGGAVVYDKRSMKTMLQDQESAQRAMNRISAVRSLRKDTHIVVATFNHVMLLAGQTTTQDQRDEAYQTVSSIPDVSRVFNEIVIQKPTSFWRRSKDSWITAKVKAALLAKKGLHSTEMKVVTENGVVYLMGIVSHKQADTASDVARRVSDVRKVVKVFEYPQ